MNRRAFLRGLPAAPMIAVPAAASSTPPTPTLELELLKGNEPISAARARLNRMFSALLDAINDLNRRVGK